MPPPHVKRVIIDLSLRFQPSDDDKRAAYRDRVALLLLDCADVPPQWLEAAAACWIAGGRPFLPSAAELIALAKAAQAEADKPKPGTNLYRRYLEFCTLRNLDLEAAEAPTRWLPAVGGTGSECLALATFEAERRRAHDMKAQGKPNYDRRFDDMDAMAVRIARRGQQP